MQLRSRGAWRDGRPFAVVPGDDGPAEAPPDTPSPRGGPARAWRVAEAVAAAGDGPSYVLVDELRGAESEITRLRAELERVEREREELRRRLDAALDEAEIGRLRSRVLLDRIELIARWLEAGKRRRRAEMLEQASHLHAVVTARGKGVGTVHLPSGEQ